MERKKLKTGPPHIVKVKVNVHGTKAHIHAHTYYRKGYTTASGKRVKGRYITRQAKVYHESGKHFTREELRFGGHSKELKSEITYEYMHGGKNGGPKINPHTHKPFTQAEAEKWAGGVVGKIYRHKMAGGH